MDLIPSISLNTSTSRLSIPLQNGISFKAEHPQKSPVGKNETLSLILIFSSLEQPANINGLSSFKFSESFTSFKVSEDENKLSPTSVTVSGRETFITGASAKTPFAIFVQPGGMFTAVPSRAKSHSNKVFPSAEKIKPSVAIVFIIK